MTSERTETVALDRSPEQVRQAVLTVVEQGTYQLLNDIGASGEVSFTSGKTAFSWGHEFVADPRPSGSGTELVVVCRTISGAPSALLDGRKNAKAAEKLVGEVRDALGA